MHTFSIILVLKDRTEYTKRLMDSWNKDKFPFHILIADGGNDQNIEECLTNFSNFPNLDYTYIRFPYDKTLRDFYEKMAHVTTLLNTSTTALMDNDDFISVDGINKCMSILEDSKYSSARGMMADTDGNNMYTEFPDSISGNSAMDRIEDQTKHFHGNYHNIIRTNHLQAAWHLIKIASPNNFRIVEQLSGYLHTVWGDSYRGDFPWMFHQHGTARTKVDGDDFTAHFPAQDVWINSDYWPSEFNKMTEAVGAAIAYQDNIDVDKAMEFFRNIYPLKLPHLKELLNRRINDAHSLGYDYNKIQNMFSIMEKYNIPRR